MADNSLLTIAQIDPIVRESMRRSGRQAVHDNQHNVIAVMRANCAERVELLLRELNETVEDAAAISVEVQFTFMAIHGVFGKLPSITILSATCKAVI